MKKTKNITVAQSIIGSMMIALSASAVAQNNNNGQFQGTSPAQSQNNRGERVVMRGQLNQLGEPSNNKVNSTPLQGFADDLPLLTVLKQVTPNGWIVRKDDNISNPVNVQKPVSWKGGQNWVTTLGMIASSNNLDILVNWNENIITVSNSKVIIVPNNPPVQNPPIQAQIQEPRVAVFELAGTRKTKDLTTGGSEAGITNYYGATNTGTAPVDAQPVPVALTNWIMLSSKTLKENVEDWARKSNYRLVWTGADYPVDNRVLTGEFDSENGPIHQLSKDYGLDNKKNNASESESRVAQPLSFLIYQNRTLVVEDIQYEQDI